MPIKLKNNKLIVQQEIDLNSILQHIQDDEDKEYPYSITAEVKRNILQDISKKLESAVVAKLNLAKKVENADWSKYEQYLDEKVQQKIEEEVKTRVEKALEKYLKNGIWSSSAIDRIVENRIKQHFSDSIHPKISRIMDQMISINPVDVEYMAEIMHEEAQAAYEAGQEQAARSIRDSI